MHENGKQLKLGYSYIACACNYNYPDMKVLSFYMHMVFREKEGGRGVEKNHYSHQILKVEEAPG